MVVRVSIRLGMSTRGEGRRAKGDGEEKMRTVSRKGSDKNQWKKAKREISMPNVGGNQIEPMGWKGEGYKWF